jgi:outer membrane putative beta-barrel porin/alpha-amylase
MRAVSILLLVAIIFPHSLRAQGSTPAVAKDATASAASRQAADDSNGAPVLPTISHGAVTFPSALAQQSASGSQQKPKPKKPKPSSDLDRPPIEGSMVGYIDNAIVGSQIRLRFDAGFDNNRPDRAEFFYAQCGCDGPPARGPQPGLVLHLNFQQLYMRAEYAPVHRFSVFAEVPVRWVQPQEFVPATIPSGGFGNQAGLSDVQAGFKFALLASHKHYLTFQFLAAFPSGDSSKGLGTNHYSVQPSLLFFQKVTDRMSFEAQLGGWHPLEGASPGFPGDVLTYGLGPSYELYRGERVRFAPVIELVGWRVLGGRETNGDFFPSPVVSSEGTNIFNLKVGARTTIGDHNSFYVGYGQALTHEIWYKHIVRVEYRYTF